MVDKVNNGFSSVQLGIDFGTTNTRISISPSPSQLPIPLNIGKDGITPFIPSAVSYRKNAKNLAEIEQIGELALENPESDELIIIRNIKRYLLSEELKEQNHSPDDEYWSTDEGKVKLWNSEFSCEEIIYEIIDYALRQAVESIKALPADRIVPHITRSNISELKTIVGIPVLAGPNIRKKIRTVMMKLGFINFTIEDQSFEPALALRPLINMDIIEPGSKLMIYDLGGGTFDVAIVETGNPNESSTTTILSQDGELIGGSNIDDDFTKYVTKKLAEEIFGFSIEEFMEFLDEEPYQKQLLQSRCQTLKESLSTSDESPLVLQNFLGEESVSLIISRKELENVVNELRISQKTFQCCLQAFKRSKAALSGEISAEIERLNHGDLSESLDHIVLVGGSTKMPLIRNHIEQYWGPDKVLEESHNLMDPFTAVANGAAWESEGDISEVMNSLPFSIQIGNDGKPEELYEAYTPTTTHISGSLTQDSPQIKEYEKKFNFKDKPKVFSLVNGRNETIRKEVFTSDILSNLTLTIDSFGQILIHSGRNLVQKIDNPSQHAAQRSAQKQKENQEWSEEQKKKSVYASNYKRSPFLDNN